MNPLILYKGYHSHNAYQAFLDAKSNNDCILFLPPSLDDYSFTQYLPFKEIILKGELWGDTEIPTGFSEKNLFPTSPLCGVFTSGTSDGAKLVLYSQENLDSSILGITKLFDQLPVDQIFCYPQPFHTFGITLGYACAQQKNWKMQFAEGHYSHKHHEMWIETLTAGTLTLGTPTHFYDLIQWVEKNNIQVPESSACIIGGAKVQKDLWFAIKEKLNIKNPSIGYGATEASPGVTHLPPGLKPKEDGEIGFPLEHVRAQHTPEGLIFSGPNLCLAMLQDGQLLFPKDYLLPDIIDIREEDKVWVYKTRSQWFINRGGEKFSLEKIEQNVMKDTGIDILCFPLKDERLGEELGLVIDSNFVDFEEKRTQVFLSLKRIFLRDFNFNYSVPVAEIPLNENRKRDRKKALEIFCKNLK